MLKERLGSSVSWHHWRKLEQWLDRGLGDTFDSSEGVMGGFGLVTRKPERFWLKGWMDLWRPWSASISFPDGNKTYPLEVKLGDFVRHAGEPTSRKNEEDEDILLQYSDSPNFPDLEFDVEFTLEGELMSLTLFG